MVLTNLAQTAMNAHRRLMMLGRVGADTLAAAALGNNLYFAPMVFGLGLMLATVPMMAREVGRNRHSVRDLRRTVRQGLWAAVLIAMPIWLLLWQGEADPAGDGAGTGPGAPRRAPICARCNGACCRSISTSSCAPSSSTLERPGWATVVAFVAVGFNLVGNWALVFGNLGFPRLGIAGSASPPACPAC